MPAASQMFSVGSCLQRVSLAGFQVLVTGQCRLRAYIRPWRGRQGRLKGSGFWQQPGNPAGTLGQNRGWNSKQAFLPVRIWQIFLPPVKRGKFRKLWSPALERRFSLLHGTLKTNQTQHQSSPDLGQTFFAVLRVICLQSVNNSLSPNEFYSLGHLLSWGHLSPPESSGMQSGSGRVCFPCRPTDITAVSTGGRVSFAARA